MGNNSHAVGYSDGSGTISNTGNAIAVPVGAAQRIVILQNVTPASTGANILYYTIDGTAPVVGAAGTLELAAGQCVILEYPPQAGVLVEGSAAGTVYTCKYA